MNISEAIKTLDGVIPSHDNKMVDFEHFPIAIAWETVKAEIERLKKEVDYCESETKVARKDIDEAVKETTEKILRSVAKDYLYCIDDIKELCKEFNVDYRDIFKSIPELVKYI